MPIAEEECYILQVGPTGKIGSHFVKAVVPNISRTEDWDPPLWFPLPVGCVFGKTEHTNLHLSIFNLFPHILFIKAIYNCHLEHSIRTRQPGLLDWLAVIPAKSKKILALKKPSFTWKQTLCFLPQHEKWGWQSWHSVPFNLWSQFMAGRIRAPQRCPCSIFPEPRNRLGFMAKGNEGC